MGGLWSELGQAPTVGPVVAASFTATAAVVAAAISAVISYLVSRRSVYINSVTVERSKWIEALRVTISKFAGAADRLAAKNASRVRTKDFPDDSEKLRTLLADLTLRLNPTEPEALNLLRAAKKLDQAARLHSAQAVLLANEIMIRHAQWVLKAEWERVKREATGALLQPVHWWRTRKRRAKYKKFLLQDGSFHRLDQIGTGKTDAELTRLLDEVQSYGRGDLAPVQ